MSYATKREHYFGQNTLAKSLHPRCYENNPRFLEMVAEGIPFESIDPVDNELPIDGLRQRGRLYRSLCEQVWDPISVGIPVDQTDRLPASAEGQKYYGISIAELLEARLIEPGTQLNGARGGTPSPRPSTALARSSFPTAARTRRHHRQERLPSARCRATAGTFWRAELPKGSQRLSRLRQNLLERRRAGSSHGSA